MQEVDLGKEFTNNGFIITDTNKFIKELDNTSISPYDLLNQLLDLQKEINNIDVTKLYEAILPSIEKIKKLTFDDEYFVKSSPTAKDKFNKDLLSLERTFNFIKEFQQAEAQMLYNKERMLQTKKEIYELDKNSNLSAAEKNQRTIALLNGNAKAYSKLYYDSLKKYESLKREQSNNYGINIIELKASLLQNIGIISTDVADLVLNEENRKAIEDTIKNMSNEVSLFAQDSIKKEEQLKSLCQSYGIAYDENIKATKRMSDEAYHFTQNNIKNDKELKSPFPSENVALTSHPEYTGPVKKGEQLAILEPQKENKKDNEKKIAEPTPAINPSYTEAVNENEQLAIPIDLSKEKNEEPKIKVIARRTCKWLNKHKKQILIAVGISLLIVATIIALQYLIPAITTMLHTSEIASLSSAMMNNGALWGNAIASEQVALHSANTALASTIQTLTGSEAIFNVGSGIWTFGGIELGPFAAAKIAEAASAASAVTAISNSVLGLGITGLGLTGLGAILQNKKSEEYTNFKEKIKNINQNVPNMQHQDVEQIINNLIVEIINNPNLTDREKQRLTNKARKVIDTSLEYEPIIDNEKEERMGR